MSKVKPRDLACFEDVEKVLGTIEAEWELQVLLNTDLRNWEYKETEPLISLVIWGDTPQGHDFWARVYNRIEGL